MNMFDKNGNLILPKDFVEENERARKKYLREKRSYKGRVGVFVEDLDMKSSEIKTFVSNPKHSGSTRFSVTWTMPKPGCTYRVCKSCKKGVEAKPLGTCKEPRHLKRHELRNVRAKERARKHKNDKYNALK